jgi:hypothetical protein
MHSTRLSFALIGCGGALLMLAGLTSCQAPAATPTASGAAPTASRVTAAPAPPRGASIEGTVVDAQGAPLAGATVRIQATTRQTITDQAGHFVLDGLPNDRAVTVSAWKDAYYCDKVESVTPPATGAKLVLRKVQTNDNPAYQWISPTGANSCYSCKPGVTQAWLENDAHGKSATNIRFLSMYYGTDVNGNRSPLTRYASSLDYGHIPLRPDPTKPYFGPGYKLDFPDTAGNCAACHIPGAAVDDPYGIDPRTVSGVNALGIHCDYCHKVAAVKLDPATRLPYPNMPGVLSQDIRRPFPEDKDRSQIFFGSMDDTNVPEAETYLPLITQSQWCAPCHRGVFWDTVVYDSFGEWLASPYSNPVTGKTCQQCHMPAPTMVGGRPLTNLAPGKGGVERDPMTIPAHTFPGASSVDLLQSAVTMTVSGRRAGDQVIVEVTIVNDKTGHDIPTDSPLRQMILLVNATDGQGQALPLLEGSTVPDWGGVGDPAKGYYAGLPGKGFAKILSELWTEISPTAAYWNPTRILSDNRIPAFGSDTTTDTFAVSVDQHVTVNVTLLFRRAFKELMRQKQWDVPDIIMEHEVIQVP